MSTANPFRAPGTWLRCQLHAHTTNSDGVASPAELTAHYAQAGFDVLAITDHWFVTDHRGAELLVIPSSELSARLDGRDAAGLVDEAEVLALGVEVLPEAREHFGSIETAARWIADHGGVPYLAHPYWSGLGAADYLKAPSLVGIEAFNGGCELESGTGAAPQLWDAVLASGRGCFGIATDDCHHPGRDSRQGWTMVRAEQCSREAVLEALRNGVCYGSSGPEIQDLIVDRDTVEVRCSGARAITLHSDPWNGARVNSDPELAGWRGQALERDTDGWITHARLSCPERGGWGRIEVLSPEGRLAWTNPIALPAGPGGPESNWES